MSGERMLRHRHAVRRKGVNAMLTTLEDALDVRIAEGASMIERAEWGDWTILLIDKKADFVQITDENSIPHAFLTLRGLLSHQPNRRWVSVDLGAVSFLLNGADCMKAGIQDAESNIGKGDLVWIRDEVHCKPLALGWALADAPELIAGASGKGVRTIHWIGDDLWDLEP